MLERLKLCYLYAFHCNPQLVVCNKDVNSVPISALCIVSPVVLLQAAIRCFIHKEMMFPCKGSSDYEWSIWIIPELKSPLEENIDEIKEYLHLITETEKGLEEWTLRKGVENTKQWMELNRNNAIIPEIKLLLSIARALPDPLINQLKDLVIESVEKKLNSTSFENKNKSMFAKAALQGPSSREELLNVFNISDTEASRLNNDIHQVIVVIGRLRDALPSDLVQEELDNILEELSFLASFIVREKYSSVSELCGCIERLFVNMVNISQPTAKCH
ncbi:hypothetical protein Sjap_009263 [Stephania japonica]|uniref:Uncharacterized protein n=1 Tax=Stephania japonica TaxID=461633 RepID=A0AAP0PD50_9MAGN